MNNCKVKIGYAKYPEDPREWDNLCTMYFFHRRYRLGDKHDMSIDDVEDYVNRKDVLFKEVYMYDHSGITISTSPFGCRWDSGKIGYIAIDYDTIRRELIGVNRYITKKVKDRVYKIMEGEIETYDCYLRGDVYYYNIVSESGELIDSCSGFYGNNFKENGLLSELPEELRDSSKFIYEWTQ